ncbi:MAG: HNH endonuclease [Acidimicrobiales bacterium]|nr:HNH endonuclease [Hyphomonadaceae bacterium]RZV40677.1 MAG: HNH endonuclease [Acidimicrobiales bacterium]
MGLISQQLPLPRDAADGAYPCLVLNADYQPLSYFPLSLWSWQDAIKAVFLERVNVVEHYDKAVHSASMEMTLPSVVALKDFVPQSRAPAFTRFNLFLRDGFACVYCGSDQELTFDHVVPRRLGGKTTWENIVAACSSCNWKKGGRSLRDAHMSLHRKPSQPTIYELQAQGRRFPPGYLHDSWLDFLYWDVELEQ